MWDKFENQDADIDAHLPDATDIMKIERDRQLELNANFTDIDDLTDTERELIQISQASGWKPI